MSRFIFGADERGRTSTLSNLPLKQARLPFRHIRKYVVYFTIKTFVCQQILQKKIFFLKNNQKLIEYVTKMQILIS